MNSASPTQQVLEFLSHPELSFGSEEDVLTLEDPTALQARVASLLDEFPDALNPEATANLKSRLDKVAWSFVALEFQARIDAAARFFEPDAGSSSDSTG